MALDGRADRWEFRGRRHLSPTPTVGRNPESTRGRQHPTGECRSPAYPDAGRGAKPASPTRWPVRRRMMTLALLAPILFFALLSTALGTVPKRFRPDPSLTRADAWINLLGEQCDRITWLASATL